MLPLCCIGCSSLTNLNLSTFDTSNVTTMQEMFASCNNLAQLDISNFNTQNVTTMYSMFADCFALIELDLSSFNTINLTNTYHMFWRCSSLTTIYISEYDEIVGTGWTMENVTISTDMFRNCSQLSNYNGTNDGTYAFAGYSEELDAYGYLTIKN